MIFHLFQHLKIHNSACLVDGLKETNPDAIKQHNWHSNRIRYLKKKKKDFEGKSNSEIQRKITQNAHKIWILLQANQFEYNATQKKKKKLHSHQQKQFLQLHSSLKPKQITTIWKTYNTDPHK